MYLFRRRTGIFTKLSRNEVLIAPHMHKGVSAISAQGWIKGGAKICHRGPLLENSSDRKVTATNRMHINDLEACEKKCCYFLVRFRSQIFDAF